MSHERLLQTVVSVLIMAGYNVSERCKMRPRSFDLIARKGETIIIVKIVPHIDSVGEESAHNFAFIAKHLNATPIIIGEKARDFELERGAVYLRYGIIATSSTTFYDFFVDNVPPLVYAQPGGLYVNINGSKLRELRESRNMSLGDLAGSLGVSRRTISKYESGMSTTLDIAIRLEEIFDSAIVEAINLLSHGSAGGLEALLDFGGKGKDSKKSKTNAADQAGGNDIAGIGAGTGIGSAAGESGKGKVAVASDAPGAIRMPQDFERMGIITHTMQRAPFEALCFYEESTILTGYGSSQKALKRAALIGNISDIIDTKAVCVLTDYQKRKKIGRTLIISEEELGTLDNGSELIALIDES
jgi:putative transcriptional regulator